MKSFYKTTLSIALIAIISGCSGKSFTMQDYADEWFNDKKETQKEVSTTSTVDNNTVTEKNEITQKEKEPAPKAENTELSSEAKQTNKSIKTEPKKTKTVEGAAIRKGVPSQVAWSSMDKHKDGQMQKSLDKWTEEEWNPTFEGDEEQAKKDENASEHFTLQHYMDKRAKYLKSEEERIKASGKPKPEANYEKMDKLPVIGK